MKPKIKPLLGPIIKDCTKRSNSTCDTCDLHGLDWENWHTDNSFGTFYIHVRKVRADEGVTWHRVYPKGIKGHEVKRISLRDGWPHWLHDNASRRKPMRKA